VAWRRRGPHKRSNSVRQFQWRKCGRWSRLTIAADRYVNLTHLIRRVGIGYVLVPGNRWTLDFQQSMDAVYLSLKLCVGRQFWHGLRPKQFEFLDDITVFCAGVFVPLCASFVPWSFMGAVWNLARNRASRLADNGFFFGWRGKDL
jgi:hypothetical protein